MSHPDDELPEAKPEIPADHRDWRDYVMVRTTARVLEWRDFGVIANALNHIALDIYNAASPSALTGLDSIKRVLEIDEVVTNPASVLWRAGIHEIGGVGTVTPVQPNPESAA